MYWSNRRGTINVKELGISYRTLVKRNLNNAWMCHGEGPYRRARMACYSELGIIYTEKEQIA